MSSFRLSFLDAFSHLYERVCLSVGPSVGPSVGHARVENTKKGVLRVQSDMCLVNEYRYYNRHKNAFFI